MNENALETEETRGCVGLKTTVCQNGVINVKRPQSDRAHSVFVDSNGGVTRCSCKGYKFNGHCVHQDEIEKRPLVRSSATAAAASSPQVATDGGTQVAHTDADTDDTETTDSEDNDADENQPQTDHWNQPVEHFDDGPVGAGESRQCQSCGSCFEVALIAATAENSQQWEEFYECQTCGARGSFRVDETRFSHETQREWTGRMAYPE